MTPPCFLFCSPVIDATEDTDELFDLFYYKNSGGQGIFSLKQIQSWYPLHFLAQNIPADTDVLEYPAWRDFERYLLKQRYDLVGISFTAQSALPVLRMITRIRKEQPWATIVLGGYGTALCTTDHPLGQQLRTAVDLLCTGEGLSFMRDYLATTRGLPANGTPQQQLPPMRLSLPWLPFSLASIPILARALGCRNQCSFCATSHQYHGEKHYLLDAESLNNHLSAILAEYPGTRELLVYDEDFLDNIDDCRRLISLFAENVPLRKQHPELIIFSSVRSLQQYTVEELKALHIGTVFIGVESTDGAPMDSCTRSKRGTADIGELFSMLHSAGIRTIASIIGGWDGQTEESLKKETRRFASLNPTWYQVLPLGAPPGTPLWHDAGKNNRRNDDLFSSTSHNIVSNLSHQNLNEKTLGRWQRETSKALIAEGGPWFFRMAEVHLSGLQQGEKHHHSRLLPLLPLVGAAGPLYFRRGAYPRRWLHFMWKALRFLPMETFISIIAGVPLVYLAIFPLQGLNRLWHLARGYREYPPVTMTRYRGQVIQRNDAQR